jgi:hypothetical protein
MEGRAMTRSTSRLLPQSLRLYVLLAVATLVFAMGCGSGAPSPASSASATPSPAASPAASDSGDPDAGAAVDAFLAFIQTDQTFHLTADMNLTVADKVVTMYLVDDVGKAAEKGTIDIRGAGVSLHLEVIAVGGTLFIRAANRGWQSVDIGSGAANPLAGLRSDDLVPVDRVNVAGTITQHLHVADAREQIDARAISGNTITDLDLDSATFDVYVIEDGTPLTAIYEFAGRGTFAGVAAPIKAKIRYDFSKFGQEVTITAPAGASPLAP